MPEIIWDALEERWFEQGVDHGVYYPQVAGVYTGGVPWNGLTSVSAAPSGAEPNKQYADNIPYVTLMSLEEFGATIECFTVPPEFNISDGLVKTANGLLVSMQTRVPFGFSWRTMKGNAQDPEAGYVIHLAYGCLVSPSEKAANTKNDSPELQSMSYTLSTTPVAMAGYQPTAYLRIDSTDTDITPTGLAALEDELYGRDTVVAPNLPLPAAVDALLGTV